MGRTAKWLCGCCMLFLLVQWLPFQYFSRDWDSEGQTSCNTSPKKGNLVDFSNICHKHGVPILLIDPSILGVISSGNNTTVSQCKLLCQEQLVTYFGVEHHLWKKRCLFTGWFRQCDWIPSSKDVDIEIWIKDFKKSLIPAMQMNGLALKHSFGKELDSYQLKFHAEGIKLDVFFVYEEDTYMWYGATQFHTGNKYKFILPKLTLCWTEFMGLLLRVPCDTESYVKVTYGPDWFEPVKKWDWKRKPPNVRENGQWPKEEWPDVLVTYQ